MARDPFDFISFDEGVERIQNAWRNIGKAYAADRVITSKDEDVVAIGDKLKVEGMEAGFEKWQLPVYFAKESSEGAQFFVTRAAANAIVAEHSHKDGDAIRFIISGSIIYNEKELNSGDWMYIPKDVRYSLKIGASGVIMCYCYPCCCIPK